jgi:acyl-CoA-dependent ceramide synthase
VYYLIQCAFWIQQVWVLNVEDRRKDHWQMFSHHIITILLLVGSYSYHFTPVGNVILILMDPCDILLSSAKCLRYMGLQATCDVFFGLFLAAWIITRHVFYNLTVWSCVRYARSLELKPKPVEANWAAGRASTWTLVGLLCILQCILFVWLSMILRLAWKVISGQSAEDTRSDEESPDEEEEEAAEEEKARQEKVIAASGKGGKGGSGLHSAQQSSSTARVGANQTKQTFHQRRKV